MNPSEFPEVQSYPEIVNFLRVQVDMLFEDLRTLLRLPVYDLDAGCNLTVAAMLFNIIAGVSVCFYDASKDALEERKNRGLRFKKLLIEYYPWDSESIAPEEGSRLLYEQARNPLVHSLGLIDVRVEEAKPQPRLRKAPLTLGAIDELEEALEKPTWLPHTLVIGPAQIEICVPTLYWGLHRLLHKLFADEGQMSRASRLFNC